MQNELEKSRAHTRKYHSQISHLHRQKVPLSQIIIREEYMHSVFKTAMKVSQVDSIVTIKGDPGVGKGLFAKMAKTFLRGIRVNSKD